MSRAPHASGGGPPRARYNSISGMCDHVEVGKRYLHGKTRLPLTVRYIGPLPPTLTRVPASQADQESQGSHGGPSRLDYWIGVEYDDPTKGKHSGTYQGRQFFKVRREGAGAFIRDKPGALLHGKTFVEALEERYGPIAGRKADASHPVHQGSCEPINSDSIGHGPQMVLGSSGGAILVEAPNLDRVKRKMSRLESLKQLGFEEEHISELGGGEEIQSLLRERLQRVTILNLSYNLIPDWATLAGILDCLPSLDTLILRHSRMSSSSPTQSIVRSNVLRRLRFLHMGDCDMSWQEVMDLAPSLEALETLHLDDTSSLRSLTLDPAAAPTRVFSNLQSLSLAGCGIDSWADVVTGLSGLYALTSLNVSGTRVNSVYGRTDPQPRLFRLTTLIWNESAIESWTDLDHIESWLDLKLTSLSFGRADTARDGQQSPTDVKDPMTIPVSWDQARPTIIARFGSLTMLNSTSVSAAERRDAEKAYLARVMRILAEDTSAQPSTWGRFAELREKYGATMATPVAPQPKATLRSKMMSLRIQMEERETFTLSVLPATTTASLRTKIGRRIKVPPDDVHIWMAKPSDLYHPWQPGPDTLERPTAASGDRTKGGDPGMAPGDKPVLEQWEKVSQIRNLDVKVGDWCEDGDVVMVDIDPPE